MSSLLDSWLSIADRALRTLGAEVAAQRPYPASASAGEPEPPEVSALTAAQRAHAAALMRVNHAGEVCAQALYEAQAVGTRDPQLAAAFMAAADEERDHLAWTAQRIKELGGQPSVLAPLWYAGSLAIGMAVSRLGDAVSLGFMAETERQVEQHLQSHLARLPSQDQASRQVVLQMQADEAAHRTTATALGGVEIPPLGRALMRGVAKVMTTVAYRV